MKALEISAWTIFGLLLVPPVAFFVFYFAAGGTKADTGHPPAILLPYLYVLFGFRFFAPIGAVLAFAPAALRFSRPAPPWSRYRPLALGIFFCLGSLIAWLHQFR